jgi:hypothetical protein
MMNMLTNLFNSYKHLIALNIEKGHKNSSNLYIAYFENSTIRFKSISSFSGDLDSNKLIQKAIRDGHDLPYETGMKIFPNLDKRKSEN